MKTEKGNHCWTQNTPKLNAAVSQNKMTGKREKTNTSLPIQMNLLNKENTVVFQRLPYFIFSSTLSHLT